VAMVKTSKIQAVLWEVSITEQEEVRNVCDVITEDSMPWPTHLFVASKETLRSKVGTIRQFVLYSEIIAAEFKASEDSTLDYLRVSYGITHDEARAWLHSMSWSFSSDVDFASLTGPIGYLKRLNLVPKDSDLTHARHLAPSTCVRSTSTPQKN